MGRIIVVTGIILIIVGILIELWGRFPFFNNLGKLPGDFIFKKGNTTVYFPLLTGLIISIVATIIINLVLRLFK